MGGENMRIIEDSLSMMMESEGSGGAEIISESDWENMTTAQKQAKGLVALQNTSSGYKRGLLVNGADYLDTPVVIYATHANGSSSQTLSYTFGTAGKYTIIAVRKNGDNTGEHDLIIKKNNESLSMNYQYPQEHNINLEIYSCYINAEVGDVVTVSNSKTYANSGFQLFILTNVNPDIVWLYDSRYNGGSTFTIALTDFYLQVSGFGYYGSNTYNLTYEIDDEVKISWSNSEWYGGTYVLALR